MIRNSPYDHPEGPLVSLVATPIGNIKDITLRALDAFKEADVIACEDTRNTGLLLSRLGIKPKKLVSLYAQTEAKNAKLLVEEAKKKNWKVCYCSDAGMPGISDPGALLVQACQEQGVPSTILPGPSASLSALVLSGIDSADFSFYGFLPTKAGQEKTMLSKLVDREETLIFYESPKRVYKTLAVLEEVFGPKREVALVRELSKIHEEVVHGTMEELVKNITEEVKGECVILVKGSSLKEEQAPEEDVLSLLKKGMKEKIPLTQLAKDVSKKTGRKKSDVYSLALTLKK